MDIVIILYFTVLLSTIGTAEAGNVCIEQQPCMVIYSTIFNHCLMCGPYICVYLTKFQVQCIS